MRHNKLWSNVHTAIWNARSSDLFQGKVYENGHICPFNGRSFCTSSLKMILQTHVNIRFRRLLIGSGRLRAFCWRWFEGLVTWTHPLQTADSDLMKVANFSEEDCRPAVETCWDKMHLYPCTYRTKKSTFNRENKENLIIFSVTADASTYAHYLFNAFDTGHTGSIKFEVRSIFFVLSAPKHIHLLFRLVSYRLILPSSGLCDSSVHPAEGLRHRKAPVDFQPLWH